MSNHWDLYCMTCTQSARYLIWANHGDDAIRDIIHAQAELIALSDAMRAFNEKAESWRLALPEHFVSLGDSEHPSIHAVADWLRNHAGHDIRACDEYGAIDQLCNQRFACSSCTNYLRCGLAVGHDGPHRTKAT